MRNPVAAALAGLLVLATITSAAPPRLADECVDPNYAKNALLFPQQFRLIGEQLPAGSGITVKFANLFDVRYNGNLKIVRNLVKNETYVLYQCGMPPPAASDIPTGAKLFAIPLSKVAVDDTTVNNFLNLLGVRERVGFASEYSIDPCMQTLHQVCSKSSVAPSEWTAWSDVNVSSQFTLQSSNTDAVFMSEANATSPLSIAFSATSDPGTLHRAEWIKFLSVFFNKETEANNMFQQISDAYNTLNQSVVAAAPAKRPLVAWLYYLNYSSPSYSTDEVQITYPAYKRQLVQDAGGDLLDLAAVSAVLDEYNVTDLGRDKDNRVTMKLKTYPNAKQILKDILTRLGVDVVIDESIYEGKRNQDAELQDFMKVFGFVAEEIPTVKFLSKLNVFRTDGQTNAGNNSAWFEMAVSRPDLVLQDMVRAITPSASKTNGAVTFVRRIDQKPRVLASSDCPLPNCEMTPASICPYIYRACDGNIVYATPEQRCAPKCPATTPAATPTQTPAGSAPGNSAHSTSAPILAVISVAIAVVVALAILV